MFGRTDKVGAMEQEGEGGRVGWKRPNEESDAATGERDSGMGESTGSASGRGQRGGGQGYVRRWARRNETDDRGGEEEAGRWTWR